MKVSVLIITYNQERFIAQAIESALMQEAGFDYELVIGEDCSTDRTRQIVVDYTTRYPEKIRPLLHERNLGSGGKRNFVRAMGACRGKYAALLEGDDYWTDPRKLQKQVDFLDRHPDCAIHFHNVEVIYDDKPGFSHPYYVPEPDGPYMHRKPKPISTLEDLVPGNFIQTPSVMFRTGLVEEWPEWFYELDVGDYALHVLNAQYGSIAYTDETMAAYRIHAHGLFTSRSEVDRLRGAICATETVNKYFQYRYDRVISKGIARKALRVVGTLKEEGHFVRSCQDAVSFLVRYGLVRRRARAIMFKGLLHIYLPRTVRFLMQVKSRAPSLASSTDAVALRRHEE
jgi:glycosyltransferase involved in cell wall biosynthesis